MDYLLLDKKLNQKRVELRLKRLSSFPYFYKNQYDETILSL